MTVFSHQQISSFLAKYLEPKCVKLFKTAIKLRYSGTALYMVLHRFFFLSASIHLCLSYSMKYLLQFQMKKWNAAYIFNKMESKFNSEFVLDNLWDSMEYYSLSFSTSLQEKLNICPHSRSVGCFMVLKFSVLN